MAEPARVDGITKEITLNKLMLFLAIQRTDRIFDSAQLVESMRS